MFTAMRCHNCGYIGNRVRILHPEGVYYWGCPKCTASIIYDDDPRIICTLGVDLTKFEQKIDDIAEVQDVIEELKDKEEWE